MPLKQVPGERDAIRLITSQGLNAEIVSFARTLIKDVDYCLECDVDAVNVVVPTSDLHLKYKLRKSRDGSTSLEKAGMK